MNIPLRGAVSANISITLQRWCSKTQLKDQLSHSSLPALNKSFSYVCRACMHINNAAIKAGDPEDV